MISRRQLIGCGLAGAAWQLAGAGAFTQSRATHSLVAGASSTIPVSLLIVDERFESARRVAASLAPGIRRATLPQDVFDLWHQELEALCRSRRDAIAGITTERGLFLIQTLAADYRLRVLSRSVHEASLVSWVIGPK